MDDSSAGETSSGERAPPAAVTNSPPLLGSTELMNFLGPLNNEHYSVLQEIFDALDMSKTDDLGFLREEDFDGHAPISVLIRRKVLMFAGHVERKLHSDMEKLTQQSATAPSVNPSTRLPAVSNEENAEIVHLNVGGMSFTTSRNTLCRIPGSVLEAMFSGRHGNSAHRTEDGTFVIDRDGSQFQHILNFLRSGTLTLPRSKADQEALAIEADFYGLSSLVNAMEMPKIDLSDLLSDEVLTIWGDEEKLRTAYHTDAANDLDLHQGLLPLFSVDDVPFSLPLRYEPIKETESISIIMDLRGSGKWKNDGSLKVGQAVSVKTLDAFRSSFNREHENLLHRLSDILLDEPVIIAGGSVLRAVTVGEKLRPLRWWSSGLSDVDLFLYASSAPEANRIAKRIWNAIAADHEKWVIVRSSGVITIQRSNGGFVQKVQIVLRLYKSPAEVLIGFDCDCCCCAYDGREVWVSPRCLLALRSGTNILNPLHAWPNSSSYEARLAKYAHRGFAVAIAGLDKTRVDYERIQKTKLLHLKGAARLMKISLAAERDTGSVLPEYRFDPLVQVSRPYVHDYRHRGDNMNPDVFAIGLQTYDHAVIGAIIPPVYGNGQQEGNGWYFHDSWTFGLAREIRDDAWTTIEDASDTEASVEDLPDRLLDAWQTGKRSREYINAQMDKFDLDNQYYDEAYEKHHD